VKKIVLLIALICTLTACSDGKAKSNISGTGSLDLGVLTAETVTETATEATQKTTVETEIQENNENPHTEFIQSEADENLPYDVEIKEKLFVVQSNDIYHNADDLSSEQRLG
jgi:hypothetical protein